MEEKFRFIVLYGLQGIIAGFSWGKKKFKGKIGMMKEKRMGWKVNYSISAKK